MFPQLIFVSIVLINTTRIVNATSVHPLYMIQYILIIISRSFVNSEAPPPLSSPDFIIS